MKNISELSHCYGCSLCAVICPQQIITLCQDKEGFYQPVIEKNDECTACGLCSKVCAFINDEKWQNENIRSFCFLEQRTLCSKEIFLRRYRF